MIIQERLRNIRKDLKLNQSEFASKIGITQSYLSKLESGSIEISIDTIQSLYSMLKINPTWLIVGQGDMYIPDTHKSQSNICNNGISDNIETIILNEKIKFLDAQLKEQREDYIKAITELSKAGIKPNSTVDEIGQTDFAKPQRAKVSVCAI